MCLCVCVLFQVCADLIVANEGYTVVEGGVSEMVMASRLCQLLCALV